MPPRNFDDFFDTARTTGEVPRDQYGHPMILRSDSPNSHKTGKWRGYTPYHRASGFGQQIEDISNLVKWQKRQVARGVCLLLNDLDEGQVDVMPPPVIEPDDCEHEPATKQEKEAWNAYAEAAEARVGSYAKAEIGTAIHAATERVDRGESAADMPPLLIDRATAYWRFCKEWGIQPTSIETFGVEDEHEVAGTWDRTGWIFGNHSILDVKTSSSMDFAGIGFAVQLGEYAHMSAYDPVLYTRIPHDVMDLETAWIIHVDRNLGGPVSLHKVDIRVGWEYATIVNQVILARRAGRKAITDVEDDEVMKQIARATDLATLQRIYDASWTAAHRELASKIAARLTT